MIDLAERNAFADFLDRLAAEPFNPDDWFRHVVNHYQDEVLEEFRRNCARLAFYVGERFPDTDEHRAQLHAWADELRSVQAA